MVLNAFCHANYFIHSNIRIEFFPDRVKISSPGWIFNASLDDIMNGIQTYRNPRLVNVFDKLGLIENFGTGIPRTLQSYAGYDVKPEFKASENSFIVTLLNVNYHRAGLKADSLNNSGSRPLDELGLGILKLIRNNPGINAPSIVSLLSEGDPSVSLCRVRNEIRRKLKDYIDHVGSNKYGGYCLKQNIIV